MRFPFSVTLLVCSEYTTYISLMSKQSVVSADAMIIPMRGKRFDICLLVALQVVAHAITLALHAGFLKATLLFLGAPCLYLAYRLRASTQWQRIIAMAALFGGWYGILFAFLADWNRIWAWPAESLPWGTWFSIVNPVEILWVFLWVLFITLFYEHFVDGPGQRPVSRNILFATIPAALISATIYVCAHAFPWIITWTYAYLVLFMLTLPPAIVLLLRRPSIIWKIVAPALFFMPMHIAHEISSLYLGHWYFPGTYLAIVPLPGNTGVPIEEFVVWIVLGSVLTLAYYELYIDDER